MINTVTEILNNEGIDRIGFINISECDIINARILPQDAKGVILFCIPYRSVKEEANDGFSEYARIYDYHKYSQELYGRIIDKMKSKTGYNYYGFCDHSPINEKLAIAKCGLGVIGRSSLFIDKKYGSFVFIGSIITNAVFSNEIFNIEQCINCGKCVTACPGTAITDKGIDRFACLSGISQKKTKTDDEKIALRANHIAWGCDVCQNVCPYNEKAVISPIEYFKATRITNIDKQFIKNLTDEEFNKYAFSYKGRKIVLDNIELL